jgi:hypothetical protein
MSGHSAANIRAVNDYLRGHPFILELVVKDYDSTHGIGLPMETGEAEGLLDAIASRDPIEAFNLGAMTGETWDEVSSWPYVGYDGEQFYEMEQGDRERGIRSALKRYPIAEWVLDGNNGYGLDELDDLLASLGVASRNVRRSGRPAARRTTARKTATKRKAPSRSKPKASAKRKTPARRKTGARR